MRERAAGHRGGAKADGRGMEVARGGGVKGEGGQAWAGDGERLAGSRTAVVAVPRHTV